MAFPYKKGTISDSGDPEPNKSGDSSTGSESSSTEEEERLRRLFQACDRDGDGYIDSHDLLHMCQILNMEDAVEEIMLQLGVDAEGRISFDDFVRCRMQLITEIEQERLREQRLGIGAARMRQEASISGRLVQRDTSALMHGSSDNSLGLAPSSQDYDSGARDLSPEPPSLYKLLGAHEPELFQECMDTPILNNLLGVLNSDVTSDQTLKDLDAESVANSSSSSLGSHGRSILKSPNKNKTSHCNEFQQVESPPLGDKLDSPPYQMTHELSGNSLTYLSPDELLLDKSITCSSLESSREKQKSDSEKDAPQGDKDEIQKAESCPVLNVSTNPSKEEAPPQNTDVSIKVKCEEESPSSKLLLDSKADHEKVPQSKKTSKKRLFSRGAKESKVGFSDVITALKDKFSSQHSSIGEDVKHHHVETKISFTTSDKIKHHDTRTDNIAVNPLGLTMRSHSSQMGLSSQPKTLSLPDTSLCSSSEMRLDGTEAPVQGQESASGSGQQESRAFGYYLGTQAPYSSVSSLLSSTVPLRYLNVKSFPKNLHLAALTSLKGEVIEINTKLQHTIAEKELIEKQLSKQQADKMRHQREFEEKLEQQTIRYEDRITELHSVIAELRKKLDRNQISVIREEDEYVEEESDGIRSNKSEEGSVSQHNIIGSQSASIADIGQEINAELSRVVCELESAIAENQQVSEVQSDILVERLTQNICDNEDKSVQVDMSDEKELLPDTLSDSSHLQNQLSFVKIENLSLKELTGRQETELNRIKAQSGGLREERDRLKRKVRELQTRIQSLEAIGRMSSPTKQPSQDYQDRSATSPNMPDGSSAPVAKVAELKKLKTWTSTDQPVLGANISQIGLPNSKVAEHLVQSLQDCSSIQEITQSASQSGSSNVPDNKIAEFEIEMERLQSRIDHLKSTNDLTQLSLEESKAHCNHLTMLIGKYESNHTALQLALKFSDRMFEGLQVLVTLLDSEIQLLVTKCKASGLGSLGYQACDETGEEDIASQVHHAQLVRRSAENVAKQLLHGRERPNQTGSSPNPWEELSSNSRTASTTSSTTSCGDMEWTKAEEQKLRDLIQHLLVERSAVATTVIELDSVHSDPFMHDTPTGTEAHRLDLENTVLIQELMAIKEEKAELKAQNYLLEKEKTSLQLHIKNQQYREQAYNIQIQNLKSEIMEQHSEQSHDSRSSLLNADNLKTLDLPQIVHDLEAALKREKLLKNRVQELVQTLDVLSQNSDFRHQQSTAFVNDLKKANSALIAAFEKAKKKYQAKLKKQDAHIRDLSEKYEIQIGHLVRTIGQLKSAAAAARQEVASETSL